MCLNWIIIPISATLSVGIGNPYLALVPPCANILFPIAVFSDCPTVNTVLLSISSVPFINVKATGIYAFLLNGTLVVGAADPAT